MELMCNLLHWLALGKLVAVISDPAFTFWRVGDAFRTTSYCNKEYGCD
jgi:hypothetical protein